MPAISRKIQWLIIAGITLVLYGPVLAEWGSDLADDANYSHGLLIPFVCLYLIKNDWHRLHAKEPIPNTAGLIIIIPALMLFLLGHTAGELFSQRLSLIFLLTGLVLYFEGTRITTILAFPLTSLLFAVPLPYVLYNSIAFPLKLLATRIATFLLNLTGIPVLAEGNIILLPHTTLEVVDACSGIRSLMTMITLAFFLSYFSLHGFWKRVLLVCLAVPLTVAANSMRVAVTGWLTRFDPSWSSGVQHEFIGWLLFVVSFAGLIFAGSILKKINVNQK